MLKFLFFISSANFLVLGEFTTEVYPDSDQTTLLAVENETNNGTGNRFTFEEDLYIKAYSYLKGSKSFNHFSYQDAKDFVEDLARWKTPKALESDFPYYLAGYDYDDRPSKLAYFLGAYINGHFYSNLKFK